MEGLDKIIEQSANSNNVLRIQYKDQGDKASIRNVEPYEIRNGKLWAYCRKRKGIRQFDMNRIDSAKVTKYPYTPKWPVKIVEKKKDGVEGLAKLAAEHKLYHLSETDLAGKTLEPRIPQNYLTENGYEEAKTPRVSFARSIDGALVGIGQNLKGKEMYVYEPDDYAAIKRQSVTTKEVPDVDLTEEEWVTTPVRLKQVGKIRVGEAVEEPLRYQYGPNDAETYKWNYEKLSNEVNGVEGLVKIAASFEVAWEQMQNDPKYHELANAETQAFLKQRELMKQLEQEQQKAGAIGGLKGVGIGTLAGAAAGAVGGLATTKFKPGWPMAHGALIGTMPGAVVGSLVGQKEGLKKYENDRSNPLFGQIRKVNQDLSRAESNSLDYMEDFQSRMAGINNVEGLAKVALDYEALYDNNPDLDQLRLKELAANEQYEKDNTAYNEALKPALAKGMWKGLGIGAGVGLVPGAFMRSPGLAAVGTIGGGMFGGLIGGEVANNRFRETSPLYKRRSRSLDQALNAQDAHINRWLELAHPEEFGKEVGLAAYAHNNKAGKDNVTK